MEARGIGISLGLNEGYGPPVTRVAARSLALGKVYGRRDTAVHALRDVTVRLPAVEFTAIMGPSGSGKSTLLHCLAALEVPTTGKVFLGETDISTLTHRERAWLRRDRLGFVFQAFNLVPTLDARDNIVLPQRLAGRVPDPVWLDQVVRQVGLSDRLHHRPAELSGGQQQRVAVARALAGQPEIIFADEPTGNLDTRAGHEVLSLLRSAVDDHAQTIVMVTHDPMAAAYADRVVFLGDGGLVDELREPTADRVLERLKSMGGFLPGRRGETAPAVRRPEPFRAVEILSPVAPPAQEEPSMRGAHVSEEPSMRGARLSEEPEQAPVEEIRYRRRTSGARTATRRQNVVLALPSRSSGWLRSLFQRRDDHGRGAQPALRGQDVRDDEVEERLLKEVRSLWDQPDERVLRFVSEAVDDEPDPPVQVDRSREQPPAAAPPRLVRQRRPADRDQARPARPRRAGEPADDPARPTWRRAADAQPIAPEPEPEPPARPVLLPDAVTRADGSPANGRAPVLRRGETTVWRGPVPPPTLEPAAWRRTPAPARDEPPPEQPPSERPTAARAPSSAAETLRRNLGLPTNDRRPDDTSTRRPEQAAGADGTTPRWQARAPRPAEPQVEPAAAGAEQAAGRHTAEPKDDTSRWQAEQVRAPQEDDAPRGAEQARRPRAAEPQDDSSRWQVRGPRRPEPQDQPAAPSAGQVDDPPRRAEQTRGPQDDTGRWRAQQVRGPRPPDPEDEVGTPSAERVHPRAPEPQDDTSGWRAEQVRDPRAPEAEPAPGRLSRWRSAEPDEPGPKPNGSSVMPPEQPRAHTNGSSAAPAGQFGSGATADSLLASLRSRLEERLAAAPPPPPVEEPVHDEPAVSELDDFLPPATGGEEQEVEPDEDLLPWPTAPRPSEADPLGDTDRQPRGRWGY